MVSDKKISAQMVDELYDLLLNLKTKQDCKDLFGDLCTFKEIEQMAQRLRAAKLLMGGATYNQVIEQTDISSATLSRVSQCVKYDTGYSKCLKK